MQNCKSDQIHSVNIMNLADEHPDGSAESGRAVNDDEFLTLYIACDRLVGQILALPDGTRGILASGSETLTILPRGMDGLEQCRKIAFLQYKKKSLAELLARLQQAQAVDHPPLVAAGTSAVQDSQRKTIAAEWPAQTEYQGGGQSALRPHPPLPDALRNTRAIKPKTGGPARTSPAFF